MTKPIERVNFEFEMSNDIDDFSWCDDLEMYNDHTTQLCWLTWLTCEYHTRKYINSITE